MLLFLRFAFDSAMPSSTVALCALVLRAMELLGGEEALLRLAGVRADMWLAIFPSAVLFSISAVSYRVDAETRPSVRFCVDRN